ncbi:cutinase family protein [Nocardia puris]|uniref:cutinase family protein n=1 Tax=Nocardia puris TaxID=208602 RepID=UPI001473B131|nr:cutinase family protein [Nocardia puris]
MIHPARVATLLLRAVAAILAAATLVGAAANASAAPGVVAPLGATCPVLSVIGVQGTDESSREAAVGVDTGVLGVVLGPLAAGGERVARTYLPYGYDEDGTRAPYAQATAAARERLEQTAIGILQRCPETRLAAVGYAHGAVPVQWWARDIGAGNSRIPADRIAAIALLANPNRAPGTPVLPGRPGARTPDAVPGTDGAHVGAVEVLASAPAGGGITAHSESAAPTEYGALTGRVADWCAAGDATCDTPADSPLAATVANLAARSSLGDPIAAIGTIAQALTRTAFRTATTVINEDLHGTTLDTLSYRPQASLGQRLVEASAPDAPAPDGHDAIAALLKLGGIGIHAVIAVARKVFTPATVAELATVGMTSPWAALAALGMKLAGAVAELVPPQTASRWINQAFTAITSTVTDPDELYQLAGAARYSDTTGRTGAYRRTPATPAGDSTLATVTRWLRAATDDLAASTPTTATPKPTTRPSATTRPSVSTPGAAPTEPSDSTTTPARPDPGTTAPTSAPKPSGVPPAGTTVPSGTAGP